jgi:hypothetical protein
MSDTQPSNHRTTNGITDQPPAAPAGPREFVIRATRRDNGRAFPPFIVTAADEAAARKLAARNWLDVEEVRPYVEVEWVKPPRLYTYGPPVSGAAFEKEYHNRPPEQQGRKDRGPSVGEVLWCVVFPCPGLIYAICLACTGARRAGTLAVVSMAGLGIGILLRVALAFASGD